MNVAEQNRNTWRLKEREDIFTWKEIKSARKK